jgi:ABC-3C biological conflict system middle component
VKTWAQRPVEHRTLLNPAFLAVIVAEAASGHHTESGRPLPFALAFLAVPLVLHEPTREALPTIATSMYAWLDRQPEARVYIPPLARQFVPHTREAVRFGARHGGLEFAAGGAVTAVALATPRPNTQTTELRRCRDRARFTGRWLARAGDPGTVLASWGLSI